MRLMRYIGCWLGLLLLAGCAAPGALGQAAAPTAGALTNAATPSTVPARRVLISAHRGGAGLGHENMLSTFRIGLNLQPDYLEMDVHLTKDGIPVIIHDATLERTCDHAGAVSTYTFEELQSVNCALTKSYGERIPRLTDVLDLARYSFSGLEIEIKVGADGKPYPGIEQKVMDAVASRNMADRVKIMAFEFDTLRRMRAIDPSVQMVALMTTAYFRRMDIGKPEAILDDVAAYGANQIGVDKSYLTPALTNAAHHRKMLVGVWTVDTENEMQKFMDMGVDSITTNRPDLLRQLVQR